VHRPETVIVFTRLGMAVASWLFGIWEAISVFAFEPAAFKFGVIVFRKTFTQPRPSLDRISGVSLGAATCACAIERGEIVLFRPRVTWFRVQTPLSIKGRIHWRGDEMCVEGRLPLGPVMFFRVLALSWVATCLFVVTHGGPLLVCGALVLALLLAGLLGCLAQKHEKQRAFLIVEELTNILRDAAQPAVAADRASPGR
jgi:hypothetical protein